MYIYIYTHLHMETRTARKRLRSPQITRCCYIVNGSSSKSISLGKHIIHFWLWGVPGKNLYVYTHIFADRMLMHLFASIF